jgi:hypothetical protein
MADAMSAKGQQLKSEDVDSHREQQNADCTDR